ncbi:MAG: 2'-5' RNA ligase family protein [Cyanobacteria bacterium SBLK]|nr:2'-5' RNA ligase family protein [Cyanobacteria bacterium SBLK]
MKQQDLLTHNTQQENQPQPTHRFFIALLPPQTVRQAANEIERYFANTYNSRKALNSPPHITLQPPFDWPIENLSILEQNLKEFATARTPIPVTLSGFGAFSPRVIYINPLKTPELMALGEDLSRHLKTNLGINHGDRRPFSPHLTVAFRDLTKANFKRAWPEFKNKAFFAEFVIPQLTLLIHNGKQWEIYREFLCTVNTTPEEKK